ncbi:threonylcarbamoyl-AMP synthase [Candidatus Nomurabacteria bacterium RIFCSPLOWO2_01_FULL_46_18]|uniref:Threonylcarbamoyl-AMP synthase n=1 Tax=Candidatus Nomurabacteria bacterium RIFCSPLOWO2_01_FULL_46_18 TaxID=1801783 RepID=A0A1F6XEN9_9BACT|nr:MAG: threonylcarbamoyl-AMP synthase [Candidatus Nomurabacteria bacterium RIFCSPLOWO2_01_FULL_46_18]
MKTEIAKLTRKNFKSVLGRAQTLIRKGKLVVFPTETVYGLGADATNERALEKIYKAKGRPSDNPIIVHVANLRQLKLLAQNPSFFEQKLIKRFWPGPLTIIFSKRKKISNIVSGGLSTVAVRMPSHPFARDLISQAGVPIAAPSANISGRPSGTLGRHLLEDLSGRVDLIVDAGPSGIGLESTVIKIEKDKILILRPGAVTREMLKKVSGQEVVFAKSKKDLQFSPGTKYRHYAPKAKLEIFKDARALKKRLAILKKKNKKVEILKKRNLKEASKNLYRDLRALDARGVDIILAGAYPAQDLGAAIMDRLRRASMR